MMHKFDYMDKACHVVVSFSLNGFESIYMKT